MDDIIEQLKDLFSYLSSREETWGAKVSEAAMGAINKRGAKIKELEGEIATYKHQQANRDEEDPGFFG